MKISLVLVLKVYDLLVYICNHTHLYLTTTKSSPQNSYAPTHPVPLIIRLEGILAKSTTCICSASTKTLAGMLLGRLFVGTGMGLGPPVASLYVTEVI